MFGVAGRKYQVNFAYFVFMRKGVERDRKRRDIIWALLRNRIDKQNREMGGTDLVEVLCVGFRLNPMWKSSSNRAKTTKTLVPRITRRRSRTLAVM